MPLFSEYSSSSAPSSSEQRLPLKYRRGESGHYFRIDERKVKLGQYLFRKHGSKVVFFGRFIAILRTWAAFLAGTNRMPWASFLLYNALGGIIWATLYGVGGYFLGDNIHRLTGPVGPITFALGLLITIASLVFVRRNEERLEEEAERALPGPLDGPEPVGRGGQDRGQEEAGLRRDTSDRLSSGGQVTLALPVEDEGDLAFALFCFMRRRNA